MNFEGIFSGIGIGLGVVGVMAAGTFILVTVGFGIVFSKMISTGRSNKAAPRLRVRAKVLAKRTRIAGARNSGHVRNVCYATFEVEGGDRVELLIPWERYGLLIEGDRGYLTFKGTNFVSFERT